jgi:hypothetical protein
LKIRSDVEIIAKLLEIDIENNQLALPSQKEMSGHLFLKKMNRPFE